MQKMAKRYVFKSEKMHEVGLEPTHANIQRP